jgi:transposase-like protein
MGKRKQHTAAFKAQVARAALTGDKTINEVAAQFGVHPTLIHDWKRRLPAGAAAVFEAGARAAPAADGQQADLFEQIGRLNMELEWVRKKLPPSRDRKRDQVGPGHPRLSVRRQCELLGLARSDVYYRPAGPAAGAGGGGPRRPAEGARQAVADGGGVRQGAEPVHQGVVGRAESSTPYLYMSCR